MPDLTAVQRFGTNLTFNETTKVLSIDLNDLTDAGDFTNGFGLDISGLTLANLDTYASKILWALILLSQQNQPVDNTDETVEVYVTNQGKRIVTRNSVSQFAFQLVANAYKQDSLGTILDPDDIGS